MEYHLKVNGATLVLHENGSTAEELSNLLTARFGASEASASRAVALEDATTALVFPLNVVAARPDFAAQSERLLVLFSWIPETILLHKLRQKGLLTDQEVRTLTPLTEDPYVTAAFEVFREEGDESDLVDTLQRIVAIRVGGPQKPVSTSGTASGQSPSKQNANKQAESGAINIDRTQTLSGNALLEQLTAALKLDAFPQAELRKLAGSLRGSGKLNRDDEAVVIQLINKELPHLQAAYEIYMEEKDENALVHSLKRVARHFGVERVVRGQPYARAILDAFAENNPMVCGAWDVYVDEHNEDDFRDTLMRCYQRLDGGLSSSSASKQGQNSASAIDKVYSTKPSEEKSALRRFVLWLHTQNRISTEEGQQLMAHVDAGAPSAEKAMRKYLASERLEADGDRLMKVVMSLLYGGEEEDAGTSEEEEEAYTFEEKGDDNDDREIRRGLEDSYGENPEEDEALRETIVLFLEDLYENKQMLTRRNVERLTALVDAGDQRLLAAFDLFNDERDLDDLVDTLQRLAEKVVIVGEDEEDEPDTQDDEEDDDEGKEDVFDFKSLFNIIAKMGLNLSQLEMIRDGMEMKHPGMEEAIDNFAQTGDQDAFKNDLLSWCENQL